MATSQSSAKSLMLNRREALKALAAIGGAAAASALVPEKWVKPVVEAGVVPAHAQSSVCAPPFTFDQCADNALDWNTTPVLTLVVTSMAIITRWCAGVPLRFSFVLKDVSGQIVFSSNPKIYFSDGYGNINARVPVLYSQITGVPFSGVTHWEFTDPRYGQMDCEWIISVPPLP